MGNRYHYDVLNCHYFKIASMNNNFPTYEIARAPGIYGIELPGLMSFEAAINGDVNKIRADGIDYLVLASPADANLTLNFVQIPETFKSDCMCFSVDQATGIRYLNTRKEPTHFALSGEFKGDEKNIRWVWYNCVAMTPGMAGDNKEQMKNPDTESVSVIASPITAGTNITLGSRKTDMLYGSMEKPVMQPNDYASGAWKFWHEKVMTPMSMITYGE